MHRATQRAAGPLLMLAALLLIHLMAAAGWPAPSLVLLLLPLVAIATLLSGLVPGLAAAALANLYYLHMNWPLGESAGHAAELALTSVVLVAAVGWLGRPPEASAWQHHADLHTDPRLKTLLETLPTGIWLTDEHGVINYGNAAGREIWAGAAHVGPDGFARYKARWVETGEPIAPEDWAVSRAVGKGETSTGELIEIEAFDGSRKFIQNSAAPLRDETGRIRGVVVVNEDVSSLFHAERALRRSEERFRVAQDLSLDGFTILSAVRNAHGRIVDFTCEYANPKSAEILRQPVDRLVGSRLLDVLANNRENSELFDRYVRVVETGEPHDLELHYQSEGIDGWFRNMAVKTGDGLAVYCSDITERKRANEALRRSEERFRRISDSNMIGVFFWREDGLITQANDAFLQALGYSQDDIAARRINWLELTPPGWEAVDEQAVAQVRGRGVAEPFEKEYLHRDGHPVPVLVGGAKVEGDESGVCWMLDISERKRSERELLEGERRFRSIFETVQDPVFVYELDAEGRPCGILEANEAVSRVYGYSSDELRTLNVGQLISAEGMIDRFPELVARMRREGSLLIESEHRSKSGTCFPVEVRAQEIEYAGRKAVLSVARDISERKKREEALRSFNDTLERRVAERTAEAEGRARQLQRLAAELTEAEQCERRKLAAVLHNNLQQLLVGARMKLGPLRKGTADPLAVATDVEALLDEAIEDARTLSHELSPQVLYDHGLLAALRWLAPRKREKYGLTVHVRAEENAEPSTEALQVFLFQAVRELLLNVTKHAGVHEAQISAQPVGEELCVSVADRGAGFDPTEIEARSEGEHLGLFGIRERLQALGGRMTVESAPGEGTRVRMYVPLATQGRHGETSAAPSSAAR